MGDWIGLLKKKKAIVKAQAAADVKEALRTLNVFKLGSFMCLNLKLENVRVIAVNLVA